MNDTKRARQYETKDKNGRRTPGRCCLRERWDTRGPPHEAAHNVDKVRPGATYSLDNLSLAPRKDICPKNERPARVRNNYGKRRDGVCFFVWRGRCSATGRAIVWTISEIKRGAGRSIEASKIETGLTSGRTQIILGLVNARAAVTAF